MTRSALKGKKNGCIRLGKTLRGKGGLRPCIELQLDVRAQSGWRQRRGKGSRHSSMAAPRLSSYGPCQYWTDSGQHAATRGTRPMSMYAPGPAQEAPRGLPGDLDPGEPCGVESAGWLEGCHRSLLDPHPYVFGPCGRVFQAPRSRAHSRMVGSDNDLS